MHHYDVQSHLARILFSFIIMKTSQDGVVKGKVFAEKSVKDLHNTYVRTGHDKTYFMLADYGVKTQQLDLFLPIY